MFQWNAMPLGLIQAPAIWSSHVAWLFDRVHLDPDLRKKFGDIPHPVKWVFQYMDDRLVYGDTAEEMTRYNGIILRTCEKHGFTVQ